MPSGKPITRALFHGLALAGALAGSASSVGGCDKHERGEDGSGGEGGGDGTLHCEKSDRSGTYLMTLTETSGDCGPLGQSIVELNDELSLPPACTLDVPDKWTRNDCKLVRYYTCVGSEGTSKWSAVTEQHDEDASVLTGILSVKLTGDQPCMGRYSILYEKQ